MARQFTQANSERFEVLTDIPTGYPFSVSGWLLLDTLPSVIGDEETMFGMSDGTVTNFVNLRCDDAADLVQFNLRQGGGPVQVLASTVALSVDTYHHICAIAASATDRRLFVDGADKQTQTTSVTYPSINRTNLGGLDLGTPGDFVDGRLAEWVIRNVALEDEEVAAEAGGVPPERVRPGSIIAYWSLPNKTGNALDFSGNAHTLTDVNTVTGADHPGVGPMFGVDDWFGVFPAMGGTPIHNYRRRWQHAFKKRESGIYDPSRDTHFDRRPSGLYVPLEKVA